MSSSPVRTRRTVLRLMTSVVAALSLPLSAPVRAGAEVGCRLPGSLRMLPPRGDLLRRARELAAARSTSREALQAAQDYFQRPKNRVALTRFEEQARRDFAAGRVALLDGWVVADAELALLALLDRC
jgi:hypothetical protein